MASGVQSSSNSPAPPGVAAGAAAAAAAAAVPRPGGRPGATPSPISLETEYLKLTESNLLEIIQTLKLLLQSSKSPADMQKRKAYTQNLVQAMQVFIAHHENAFAIAAAMKSNVLVALTPYINSHNPLLMDLFNEPKTMRDKVQAIHSHLWQDLPADEMDTSSV